MTATKVIIGSKQTGRRVACYPNGKAVYQFWYTTILGPNMSGYEKQFPSQVDALEAANNWVNEQSETWTTYP